MYWFRHLQLRWKLFIIAMPLVLIPLLLFAIFIGSISIGQAYQGITRASKDDLEHMSNFTLDLLDGHYRQYEVYQQEREVAVRQKLKDIVDLAYNLVETHHEQIASEQLSLNNVMRAARNGMKSTSVGGGGHISVMNSSGDLIVHPVSEGTNIYGSKDEKGRFFVKEMCDTAISSKPGEVLYTKYHLKNELLGDERPRHKIVAYRYFSEWGWIISVSSYLDEIYDEKPFENRAFAALKEHIKEKKVGQTGFIYAADCNGILAIHPAFEGQSVYTWVEGDGREALRDLCEKKEPHRWVRSPWKNDSGAGGRIKIAHFEYFQPWNWVVVVETFEDELFGPALETKGYILVSVIFLSFLVSGAAGMLTFYAAKRFTFPIFRMTEEIGRAKGGRFVKKITIPEGEELKKLAIAFNNMSDLIKRDMALEEKLARMEKMASIGVLSSGVAHEINNPMSVILGYACHLERKLDETDANFHFVQEIKQESKRCVKIVQNLLDYARVPHLTKVPTDINVLLDQIIDFAAGHTDMENVELIKEHGRDIPVIEVDRDQLRQVVMNLILNAAVAMADGGELIITTSRKNGHLLITFADSGQGIQAEDLKDVFEPFFTTKSKGTGLGLAISKQIVDAHLGNIDIVSVVGEGTTVTVSLPVK